MKKVIITPSKLKGSVKIPPSKSMAHRAIICASLSKGESVISNIDFSEDIIATMEGMKSLGANIKVEKDKLIINGENILKDSNYKVIDCYNILNSDEKLNFQIENNQFKIYSSKAGHAMMATQVISDYEDYASLKVNKITTSSDNIKGKTVPNSNIIVVSQKGTVGTAQADKNGKFEVKIPPMISGTSLEILVYDDNIFSILYKFQKVMVRKSLFTS